MELIKGADSVELKVTVPAARPPGRRSRACRSTRSRRSRARCSSSTRRTSPSTRPAWSCAPGGSRAAAATRSSSSDRSCPAELPAELRRHADFNVEVDVLPGGFVCSASFKGRTTGAEIREAVARHDPAPQALLQGPAGLLRAARPGGHRPRLARPARPDVHPEGQVRRTRPSDQRPAPLVAEMWLYPDGSRILELSTKCPPTETFQVAAEARAYLVARDRARRRPADEDRRRRSSSTPAQLARPRRATRGRPATRAAAPPHGARGIGCGDS